MQRRSLWVVMFAWLLLAAGDQVGLWLAWELEPINGHTPPQGFVVTVTNREGRAVPPPLHIPWVRCRPTEVKDAMYCTAFGCPPSGTYDVAVVADYGKEGASRAATVSCIIVPALPCQCITGLEKPPPLFPPPPPPPPSLHITPDIPPLVQIGPDGLGLIDASTPIQEPAVPPPAPAVAGT